MPVLNTTNVLRLMPKPVKPVMWRVQFMARGKPERSPTGVTYMKSPNEEAVSLMVRSRYPKRAFKVQAAEEYDQESKDASTRTQKEIERNSRPKVAKGKTR